MPETTTNPADLPPFEVSPDVREKNRQLQELEAAMPPPTWDEVKPEWMWVRDQMETGAIWELLRGFVPDEELQPWLIFDGRYVAVYQQRIVGVDFDPLQLRLDKAREFGVHPERVVITYIGEYR